MKYIWLVACREYCEMVKTKGFWIGLGMFPFMLFLTIQVPMWLETKGAPTRYYVIVDQSKTLAPIVDEAVEKGYQKALFGALSEYAGKYAPSPDTDFPTFDGFTAQGGQDAFLAQLQPRQKPGAPAFQPPRRYFQAVKLPPEINGDADLDTVAQALRPYLRGEKKLDAGGWPVELSAAILIPRDLDEQIVRPGKVPSRPRTAAGGIAYWAGNLADTKLRELVEFTVNTEIRRREFLARGMNADAISQVERTYAPLVSLNPTKETGHEAVGAVDVVMQWAPSGFVYLLWISVFTIAGMLLNNIIEEKSNRIIEVLLSSVTPGELMLGKLLGIAAVGFSTVGSWIIMLFAILNWKSGGGGSEAPRLILSALHTSNLIPLFVVYFVLGYLMYAALFLSVGSVCNTIKEAQSYMGVVTMFLMVPFMTMMYIPKDPNGMVARVLSWVPIYTPFIMMNRANAKPPMVDLVGTLILLVGCTVLALWMAGKIFRIGILRTGQPPKIIELLRWLKG